VPQGGWRHAAAAAVAVMLSSGAMLAPWLGGGLAGVSLDSLFLLRDTAFGPRHAADDAKVALVLIDEATYDTPPFAGLPKDLWTPQFGRVIAALDQAGAAAIGFDILLPTSLAPYQDDHDLAFQTALHAAAADHRLVLAKLRSATKMQLPSPIQMRIVSPANVRATNVWRDEDDIVRRVPTSLRLAGPAGGSQTTFVEELAQRAGAPKRADDLMLNFDGGMPFPTYAFSDVFACADTAFLARQFAGKVVLIGTGLDVEDRLLTSRRFINPPERLSGPRCTPGGAALVTAERATVPGVFVNATAVDNLLRGEGLREVAPVTGASFVVLAAGLAALLALGAGLAIGLAGLVAVVGGTTAIATLLFEHAVVTPWLQAAGAAALSFALLVGYRFLVADRDKRRIRQMFSLYLAPSVIERMVAADRLPSMSGERREMTFFFSDIGGFTTLTESADPAVLASVLNGYFDGVCKAIMRHGGMVIEFLGDGVQAMFGAPDVQPDHAARALAAAREVRRFTEQYRGAGVPAELGLGGTRIGVHTGEATVGNIGAPQRLKYAALGDVVNSTSRLEGLNKFFATGVCISEETRAAAGDADTRPLGAFLLKGKTKLVLVHELLEAGDAAADYMGAYREAYALLAAGSPAAIDALERLHAERPDDGCVVFHLGRARDGVVSATIEMSEK
jgi:adenylate cyclase